jgi:DNA-binding transcriptional LysR family regulator
MLPDLSTIDLFLKAVRLGSLSKAAEACHLSLSAASRRLAYLEDRLGSPLFDRQHSGMAPTPAGEALARHAKVVMSDVEAMLDALSDFAGGTVGRVRLHANTSTMSQDLPERLAKWSQQHPKIKLEIHEARSRAIVEAVRSGTADLGVVTCPPEQDLRYEPYGPDRLSVVVPARHALRGKRLQFLDLLDYDFVGLDDSAVITQSMKRAAESVGKYLRLRMQVSSFEAACRLVAAGQGIGVLPKACVETFRTSMKLRLIDLTDDWAYRMTYICVRPGRLPVAVDRFVNFLLERGPAEDQKRQ